MMLMFTYFEVEVDDRMNSPTEPLIGSYLLVRSVRFRNEQVLTQEVMTGEGNQRLKGQHLIKHTHTDAHSEEGHVRL